MSRLELYFKYLGQIILFFIGIDITLYSTLLIFGFEINKYLYPSSLAIAAILTLYLNKNNLNKTIYYTSLICSLLFLFVISLLCSTIIDYSWDGNAYHKTAIGFFANGWNPVYETAKDFVLKEFPAISQSDYIWEEHYPKATWFFAASSYLFWGSIETGKSYNLLMMLATFSLIFSFLIKKKASFLFSLIFSLAAALNPIAIAQCFTFYVDGFLQLCILLLIFEFYVYLETNDNKIKIATLLSISFLLIITINIKFTGLLFSFFYIIFFLLYYLYQNKQLKTTFFLGLFFLAVGLFSTFWVGESSYTKNIIYNGNLVYPLLGEGKFDIITPMSPFTEVNRFFNLFTSIFSELDNFLYSSGRTASLKIPFSIHSSELKNLIYTDSRISGFGILFSGILIISLVLFVLFFKSKRIYLKSKFLFGYALFTSAFFCIVITESWWARYSPYIYFIVLLGLIATQSFQKVTIRRTITLIFGFLLITNNLLFLSGVVDFNNINKIIKNEIKKTKNHEVCLKNTTRAPGLIFNFIDSGAKITSSCKSINDEKLNTIHYFDFKYITK